MSAPADYSVDNVVVVVDATLAVVVVVDAGTVLPRGP